MANLRTKFEVPIFAISISQNRQHGTQEAFGRASLPKISQMS